MMAVRSFWKDAGNNSQYLIFSVLYSLSFATLFFHIFFQFDLLLLNLLLLQLPMILSKRNTLHGYLSGMRTVVK